MTPTSQITGGGAILAAESMFSRLHRGRPTLLVPNASYGMLVLLAAHGIAAGDEVIIPALDWPSTRAVIRFLGANAVPVDVDPLTLTIDPAAAAAAVTRRTRAVVACHLHGVPADIPALIKAVGNLPVIEDAAQAFGACLDGRPVGALAAGAVLSLGPGKHLDAGEGGVLIAPNRSIMRAAIGLSSHPVRQLIAGLDEPDLEFLSMRPHPVTAILALRQLRRWDSRRVGRVVGNTQRLIRSAPGVRPVGDDPRRRCTSQPVPLIGTSQALAALPAALQTPIPTGARLLGQTFRCPPLEHIWLSAPARNVRCRAEDREHLVLTEGGPHQVGPDTGGAS